MISSQFSSTGVCLSDRPCRHKRLSMMSRKFGSHMSFAAGSREAPENTFRCLKRPEDQARPFELFFFQRHFFELYAFPAVFYEIADILMAFAFGICQNLLPVKIAE